MSAIRLARPSITLAQLQQSNPARYRLGATLLIGIIAVALLNLVLYVATSQGTYELSRLKLEKHDLTTTSDILRAQVDSLASDQNLANAAQGLGMIANSSPAFLRLSDEKVFGKPKPAYLGTTSHTSQNLVPNALLTTTTKVGSLVPEVPANVATSNPAGTALTLNSGELPVSPTH